MVTLLMNTSPQVLSFATDPLECLHAVWEHYDKKADFDMIKADWPSDYVDLLGKVDSSLIQTWPVQDFREKDGQLAAIHVRIRPAGLSLLQRPRAVHRQVTVDGKKVDLRSGRDYMLMTAPIENLAEQAPTWLKELEAEQDLKAFRAKRLQLQRLLAYRAHELPPMLHDRIISVLDQLIKPSDGDQPQNAEGVSECVGV